MHTSPAAAAANDDEDETSPCLHMGGIDVLITQSFTGLCCLFILHLVCSCPRYCHLNWKSFPGCTTSAKQLHLTTQRPLILLWWIALQFWSLSSISVQSFLMAQSSFRTEKVDYMHYSRSNIVALLQNPPSTPLATTHTCTHIHIHTNTLSPSLFAVMKYAHSVYSLINWGCRH